MERHALIIRGFFEEKHITYVNELINRYKFFLTSVEGGAWEQDKEISILEEPTIDKLANITTNLKPDFALIILIGHGGLHNYQHFKINAKDIILVGQLYLNIKKQLILVESCRTFIDYQCNTVDLLGRIPYYKNGGKFRFPLSKEQSKKIFIQNLSTCEDGTVICFACGPNEKAKNLFFSDCFLRSAIKWSESNKDSTTIDIISLMEDVKIEVQKKANEHDHTQTPHVNGSLLFPIAVSRH